MPPDLGTLGEPSPSKPDGDARVAIATPDAETRIAELERLLAQRTRHLDEARRALDRQFLDAAAVPGDRVGQTLSTRLHEVVAELLRVGGELEDQNTALATANWHLEQRVAERTAALQATLDAKRESEARFRQVAEGTPQLVWVSYPEGEWRYANRRWLAYTGQTEEETLGLGWLDAVHPDDRERTMQAWHHASIYAEPIFVEHRLRSVTGEWRWFEMQSLPTGGLSDGDLQWVGTSTDIHARKMTEQALRDANTALQRDLDRSRRELAESEARFRAYFQIAPEALFVVALAPDGRFLHEAVNQPFERLTGFHEDEVQNREARAFMPAETASVFEESYRACMDVGGPSSFDALVSLPVGDRTLRVTLLPTLGRDGGGEATRCLFGSVRDLSNAPNAPTSPALDA